MKKRIYLFIILVNFVSLTLNAQMRLLQNGRVQVGTLKLAEEDLENVTTMQVFGGYGDMRAGSKLTFGDFGRNSRQGWNVFLGEYGNIDSDQLWLHGKLGIYLTANGYANNIVAYYNPSANSNFIFNTDLRVNGIHIASDARLKENIQSLQNPLSIIDQISGVSYTYRLSEIENSREQDESNFSGTLSPEALAARENTGTTTDSGYSDKDKKNEQIQQEIDKKEAENANRKRIGFLAQDIQKVLPELVQTDEKGLMSIDYTGFIPLIVESIKEMQQTILKQNEQIENLQNLLTVETKSQPSSNIPNNPGLLEGAKLYNREGASVSYSLPATFTNANLQIFDIAGKLIKRIELDGGKNILDINRSEIGYGTFIYVLFVDDKKADALKKYVN